ncbi:Transcription initiation factor IIA large subunit [Golovinomyces cichoracearum]|uniref:Transcription initiation factor IIA large subunit n=1 Tax=Golovinomyces cichoracearum TaxID=62708 RepID=A0A420ILV6_9PEZI|nr:Transcription initiation factor IIA large subunit [Golovinomyces cichoracearum]
MSNTQVGSVYQQIIADVIESSRVDFEEGGVDESVLEALRKGWQTKLSQLEVAAFPWDPTPDPVPPMPNGPSISSNGVNYQHPGGNQALPLQPLQQIGMNSVNSPHIKAEPGLEGSSLSQYNSHIPNLPATTTTAQQRAAAHLHNNYGPLVRSFNTYNGDTELMCRSEIDKLIRTKIEAIGSAMEGGGLMLPLHQINSHACKIPEKNSTPREKIRARMDGGDDDDDEGKYEELDEDAINSDLDDPDDGLNEDEEEEDGMGHIMLCMYDKVQRVKNKWKCVMKDGVLTVNNKEYVFHKASGEYEW